MIKTDDQSVYTLLENRKRTIGYLIYMLEQFNDILKIYTRNFIEPRVLLNQLI
ncbi:MAG: hypothetical protein V2I33_04555 [Kangiellaceae bacterium]|nr:hypothetical protein [Kangiellaceae bacterium]